MNRTAAIAQRIADDVAAPIDVNEFTDNIPGGKADGKSLKDIADENEYDLDKLTEQLDMGMDVEMEHTPDPEIAKEISKDHLVESDKYYDLLDLMEKKF